MFYSRWQLRILCVLVIALLSLSCSKQAKIFSPKEYLVSSPDYPTRSTTAGNLASTALRQRHNLDIVFYPTALLRPNQFAFVGEGMTQAEIEYAVNLYPEGSNDQFLIGTMSGDDIKKFILARSQEVYGLDLDVAGMKYDIRIIGGLVTINNFSLERGVRFEDERKYRVAISNSFYFSGLSIPGYKYRNGLNFSFHATSKNMVSVREAVRTYLLKQSHVPVLDELRAQVLCLELGSAGPKTIAEIQGSGHLSPFYGQRVVTQGIVTAIGINDWYPGGTDFFIQSPTEDGREDTSEALHVYVRDEDLQLRLNLRPGDLIEIAGTAFEQITNSGLGLTSLRFVTRITKLAENQPLPPATILGARGRPIPRPLISTYRGNLNNKPALNLNDAIDFWESLEGMRVMIYDPQIVGFRGGQESASNMTPKGYLNLFVRPDGLTKDPNSTPSGGLIAFPENNDFNPSIMQIATHHLTRDLKTNFVYNVGNIINGPVTGLLSYEKNFFGDGEFVMLLPEPQANITTAQDSLVTLNDRPRSILPKSEKHLSVATYNVENLGAYDEGRLVDLAKLIQSNLNCPDLVNFAEIQDRNGPDFSDSAGGEPTLRRLIELIDCPGDTYQFVNLNPIIHDEGGQPGGNIRVAMLYKSNRVQFDFRPPPDSLTEAIIYPNGHMNYNPVRVFPNDQAFDHTRKSLVAEFRFQGERIFMIGNHFNSKLGDTGMWAAHQPVNLGSEVRRTQLADKINDFVELLARLAPEAHVIVLGDFNAYFVENPMKVLEGEHLTNLINYGNLVAPNDRYTTSYNGNSQSLDYIFVGQSLLQREPRLQILHINSDYMGRFSDHDPVLATFRFAP